MRGSSWPASASSLFLIPPNGPRIAGSFGIGLLAALYATQARTHGPVPALHLAGVVLAVIAGAGALALPAVRNTALAR